MKENEILKTCHICGCYDDMACVHPEKGPCAWDETADPGKPTCTHCSEKLTGVARPWQSPRWWIEWDRSPTNEAGGKHLSGFHNSRHAPTAEVASELVVKQFTFDQGRNVYVRSVERVPNFLAQTKPGLDLTWWEDQAVHYALIVSAEPDTYGLIDLMNAIDDSYSEAVSRDGEPGPRAGTITYDMNEEETRLLIRGKNRRILVTITLEQLPQTTHEIAATDD